ncbi:interleukin 17a/f3 [Xenentodon cancila]
MLLVLRALVVLGCASLVHATGRGQVVSVQVRQGTEAKIVKLVLDTSELPQVPSNFNSNIANKSLSPWTYSDSCVASRLPRRISQAQCLTSGCLSLQGEGEDATLEAKPIQYEILVLHRVPRQRHNRKEGRKGGKAKKYDLMLGTQVITVGCTCVRPTVVPQQ